MKAFMDSVRRFVDRMISEGEKHKVQRVILHTQSFPDESITALVVKTTNLEVKFEPSDGAALIVSVETEDARDTAKSVSFSAKIEDSVLTVTSKEGRSFHNTELVVRCPSKKSFDVVTKNGDVSITDLQATSVVVKTESADVSVNGVVGDRIILTSQNGDITTMNVDSKAKIEASSVNGDVNR